MTMLVMMVMRVVTDNGEECDDGDGEESDVGDDGLHDPDLSLWVAPSSKELQSERSPESVI